MDPDKSKGEIPPARDRLGPGNARWRGEAPPGNRRVPPLRSRLGRLARLLWQSSRALGLAAAYALLFAWLLSGPPLPETRFAEALAVPEAPLWQPPEAGRRFGTTGAGADLFALSRAALARGAALAALGAAVAVALALLALSLFATGEGRRRFAALEALGAVPALAPLALLALVAAASGSAPFLWGSVLFFLALALSGELAVWGAKQDLRSDSVASLCLGIPRSGLLRLRYARRLLPWAAGTVALLVPRLMLLEMALSFVGLGGGAPSLGTIVAHGRDTMIEAPWIAIYPGLLATATVAAFVALGELAAPRETERKLWL